MDLRKVITPTLTSAFVFFSSLSIAQLSEGGLPYSFKAGLDLKPEVVVMPGFDEEVLKAEDVINNQKKDRPYRFGKNFDVAFDNQHHGTWTELKNGDRIWSMAIHSPGAFSINLTFSSYQLPAGGKLFIYNASKDHVIGAFTSANNVPEGVFATDLVKGDKIILEYYEPRSVRGQGALAISMVTHAYLDVFNMAKGFGSSGSCNMNVNCPQGAAWQDQKRSVVMLVSGGNGFCTGALINNTLNDGTPYVLTANHCGNSGFANWVFRFNWEAAGCSNPGSSPSYVSLTGAISRASNANSDFRLVELVNQVPASYNGYFSGWNNLTTPPVSTVGIHHPSGDIKKISFDNNPAIATNWGGADTWEVVSWDLLTTTEPGSSGSPLFNQNGQIIGQLFGGSAACGNTLSDYYGRLSTSWNGASSSSRLNDWLDPNNTGVTSLGGFDPNVPSLQLDAGLTFLVSPASGSSSCDDSLQPVVQLKNFGSDTITNVQIQWQMNSGSTGNFNWSGMLLSGSSVSIQLPFQMLQSGTNVFTTYINQVNSVIDQNPLNDTLTATFIKISPSGQQLPISQGFETTFPATGWAIDNPDGSDTWLKDPQRGGHGLSTGSIYVDNYNYNGNGSRDGLISPYLDFSSSASPMLTFDYAYARYDNSNFDSLIVYYSEDCGNTWNRIFSKGNLDLVTNGQTNTSSVFYPNSSQWKSDTIQLGPLSLGPNVQFRFENYNGYGNRLYLDNINISEPNSIHEYSRRTMLQVYPNPATSAVNLIISEDGEYSLLNVLGEKIRHKRVQKGHNNINIEGVAPGIYTIVVGTSIGVQTAKILIKD